MGIRWRNCQSMILGRSSQIGFVLDRFNTVMGAIFPGRSEYVLSGPADLAGLRSKFLENDPALQAYPLSVEGRVVLLFLIFVGRYPDALSREKWATEVYAQGMEKTLDLFLESRPFLASMRARATSRLVPAARGTLHIDVSHTLGYPYNSGIQRVTRKIVGSLISNSSSNPSDGSKNILLYRMDEQGQPRRLSPSEIHRILDFESIFQKLAFFEKVRWTLGFILGIPGRFLSYLQKDLKYLMGQSYHRIRDHFLQPLAEHYGLFRAIFNAIDRYKVHVKWFLFDFAQRVQQFKNQWRGGSFETLFFFENNLMTSEVPLEEKRIEFYLALKSSLPNRLSLVVHDLIPIIAPEFCTVNEMFVHYVRLFRVVDQICCVSESVQRDVENLAKIVLRENPEPLKVTFQHLGGDFSPRRTEKQGGRQLSNKPQILCVGTFEPRKNQVTILRAAYLLHKKGIPFELVFVGNPGWKNEVFIAEKELLDPAGEFVKVHVRVKDAELEALYERSKFTLFLSHVEGFGLPILESLQRGRPVIVSNRGCMAEVAEMAGGCVLVDPLRIVEIAAAIEALLTNEKLYQQKVSEIRQLGHLSWERYSEEIYKFAAQ